MIINRKLRSLSYVGSSYIPKGMAKTKGKGRGYIIADKLKRLLEEKGITQYKLAQKSGIPQPQISDYIRGRYGVSRATLEKLAQALGVSPSYFLEEEPPKEYPPTSDVVEREYIIIPIITGVGAGGEVITDGYTLIKRSRLPKRSVAGFEVRGDSMEPSIPKGYIVLIDPEDTELREGKVYLFATESGGRENGLILRRVHRVNGEWELVPDNRKYAPQRLTPDFRVVGRAIKKIPPVEVEDIE